MMTQTILYYGVLNFQKGMDHVVEKSCSKIKLFNKYIYGQTLQQIYLRISRMIVFT